MIRLLVADDHAIVRKGIKQLFQLGQDITIVGEATNGREVLEKLRENAIDVLVLDLTMPGISGMDLISRIRAHGNTPYILVLSMHNELQIARRALKAGANGYLTKDSDPEILLEAVRKIAGGGRYLDHTLAQQMAFCDNEIGDHAQHEQLSDREFHILSLLARGKSINEIAEELVISNKTVSTHKARLMRKMDFRSNADLVRYALENELLE
jgi:DNA-binding NarL/FixJ family response regulator